MVTLDEARALMLQRLPKLFVDAEQWHKNAIESTVESKDWGYVFYLDSFSADKVCMAVLVNKSTGDMAKCMAYPVAVTVALDRLGWRLLGR